MKKLILIAGLLLVASNSWGEERFIVGGVAQKCEYFLSTYETTIENNESIVPELSGQFAKMHSYNYQHAFISYLSGRNASRLNNGGLKNLADGTDFVLAYVKNECTKYPNRHVFAVLDNYYDELPYYIE